ncbi:MAG: GNAT family N-acetyltransferase [Candidatus Omnitrophica bacterium]|nr:GNAT family N-acetyltransferase [Candidatus Omnitrophota bacterium]
MNLRFVDIENKDNLLCNVGSIEGLFKECFGKEISKALWAWAYLENPLGSPLVSLCLDEDVLVGHYAVIPINLRSKNETIKACLSMTTMVKEEYRKHGIFVELAKQVYAKASQQGYKLVFGFPNKNSAPGFRKRLGWEIQSGRVVSLTKKNILDCDVLLNKLNDCHSLRLDIIDQEFRRWRLSKPGAQYIDRGNLVLKKYGQMLDIVFVEDGFENSLNDYEQYNVLCDENDLDSKELIGFEYYFGYRVFEDNLAVQFKKDLLLSDLF